MNHLRILKNCRLEPELGNQETKQGKGIGTRGIEPGLGNQETKQGKGIGTRGIEPGLGNQEIKQRKGIGTRGIEPGGTETKGRGLQVMS